VSKKSEIEARDKRREQLAAHARKIVVRAAREDKEKFEAVARDVERGRGR
jgi:hypothetical protein